LSRNLSFLATLLTVASLLIAAGCGTSSKTTTNQSPFPNPSPSPTQNPSPSPTPNPSPSPSPSPARSTAPDNFYAIMYEVVARNPIPWKPIVVDTNANNGIGSMEAIYESPLTQTYTLQFCPFAKGFQGCMDLATYSGQQDQNTPPTINFTVSKGNWAGAFQLLTGGIQVDASSIGNVPATNFRAALLAAATLTDGTNTAVGAETGSGTIETTGFTTTIKISGAKPNNSYKVQFCTLYNSCNDLGTATSNGNGDISASVDTRTQSGIIGTFALSDAAGFEYVAGFRVQ
jgi:hypothetical protein